MPNVCDQIPGLTTAEKLAAMEALWSSLHDTFEAESPPEWHLEILNQRKALIESGNAVYQDWDEVKKELKSGMA